jgi:HAD superfamily hydrolase (TIGR01509 family)
MKYKCIIFDCDGVLVDSEIITCEILITMATSLGLNIEMEFAQRNFLGKSLNSIMEYLNVNLEGNLPESFEKEYRSKTYEAFKYDLQPIEGVHSLLNRLDVPFCVASSGPLEKINLSLTTTGLIDKFKNKMFSCYDLKKWKPNPDIFLYAAKNMGYLPKECVIIEDSISGIQAAIAGGFDVYGYVEKRNDNLLEGFDIPIFNDMNILDKLLNS